MPARVIEAVTCLGCGCACDDLKVRVGGGRIEEVLPPCPLARAWFGDGTVPEEVLVEGRRVPLDRALAVAADLLAAGTGRTVIYLAPDLTSQAQRIAVALADLLRGVVDGATSAPAAQGLLVGQRRGRATATLGELRNRADVVLFWGVDPSERYPRYLERYAVAPAGTQVPEGRAGRTLISVDIGDDRGPTDADLLVAVPPNQEVAALTLLRAAVLGRPTGEVPDRLRPVLRLATHLTQARYAALVHEAEPGSTPRDPHRTEGLVALAQALNGATRAALSSLRAGGNRSGAEAVLTWQTGFPMAVDFADGTPRYTPGRRVRERLETGAASAALIAGSSGPVPAGSATVVIGPRASGTGARVAIDTGVAGIHEAGTAYRMDEVPLPLTPPLPGVRGAAETLARLLDAVRARLRKEAP